MDLWESLNFIIELLVAQGLFVAGKPTKPGFPFRLAVIAVTGAVVSLLLNFQLQMHIFPDERYLALLANARQLILFALTAGGIYWAYSCTLLQAFLWGICGYIVQNMAFSFNECVNACWDMAHISVSDEVLLERCASVVGFAIVYCISWFVFIRKIRNARDGVESRKACLLGAGMLFLVIAISSRGHVLTQSDQFWFRLMEMLGCVLGLSVVVELVDNRRLAVDLDNIRYRMELQANNYAQLEKVIQETNLRCHDFKYQVLALRHNPDGGDANAHVLEEMEDTISVYDSVARTGNESLDTVLTEKSLLCNRSGIRMTYLVDGERLNILSAKEIYTLFGNALDNAIEAVSRLPDEDRRIIHLTAMCGGPFLNIHVQNYFDGEIALEDGLPRTTKPDPGVHGYGMKSIRMIVENNGGSMTVSASEGIFDLNIVLPLPDTESHPS